MNSPDLDELAPGTPAPATATATARDATTAAAPAAPGGRSTARGLVEAIRPHHWVKNVLLFVPLLLSHQVGDASRLAAAAVGFVAFCLCASAAYVLNDLCDREHDRHHPVKRARPFAAGRLSARAGALTAGGLLAGGVALAALLLPPRFTGLLLLYVATTAAYSLYLKRKLLLDVFVLAGLYTGRVLAGGAAAGVAVSEWLLAFCIFFFLSLAFLKRYAELLHLRDGPARAQVRGRAYRVEDLGVIEAVGPASGYLAVLVLALYVNQSPEAVRLYRAPSLLWLVCPVMLYWVTRLWFLARRGAMNEDPILFALKDRVSLLAAGATFLLCIAAWLGVRP